MRFPSIKNLATSLKSTCIRFPFEILFSLAGTIFATINIEFNDINPVVESFCLRGMMIGNLGLLLSLTATLFSAGKNITGWTRFYLRLSAASLAILLFFLIDPSLRQSDYIRFFLLSLSFHLLTSYAAFISKGHIQGFWQFNKTLFLRFLTSVLYAGVLFTGLAAAISAMNFLFNFNFEWDTFLILWAWIVGVFSTTFFLAGIPTNLSDLDNDNSYPKGLKLFTQYVLIPLATVYVIILLAYEIKILVQWNLPKGSVSNLILGYAVFGILSLLLVYPIREKEENRWMKMYTHSFYFLMLPLLILLFVAIKARVSFYGITEERYFLIILSIWLLFISVYFLLFKRQNIKLIPITLSIVTIFSIYGPQSAFTIAKYSQTKILISLFEKNNAYKNKKLMPIDSNRIKSDDGEQAVSTLRYLVYDHDIMSLQPYFDKDLKKVTDSIERKIKRNNANKFTNDYELRDQKFEWIRRYLHLNKFSEYRFSVDTVESYGNILISSNYFYTDNDLVNVKNYDHLLTSTDIDTIARNFNGSSFERKTIMGKEYVLKIDNEMVIFNSDEISTGLLRSVDINKYYEKNKDANSNEKRYKLPQTMLTFTKETKLFKVTLLINYLRYETLKKGYTYDISGMYLIKKK